MLMYVLGIMGSGKTLFTTGFALNFSKENPNSKIFSNYKLNTKIIKNAVYSPFMFLPFTELQNSLLICDDFDSLANLKAFTSVIGSMSRKLNLTIILTAQYYTMIPKKLREMSNYEIRTKYEKKTDKLTIVFLEPNNNITVKIIENAVKKLKGLYDTSEIVPIPLKRIIISEIVKVSKTIDDIEYNLFLYTKNESKREKLLKEICKNFSF